jgi:hypothetical protein
MQGELLYDMKLKFLPLIVIGAVPEGMRINIPFNGEVSGQTIKGKVEGTDYVLLRSDGVGLLHIHAVLTTDGGDLISIQGSGISTATPDGRYAIKEVLTYQTGSEKFACLNFTQAFGDGFSDMRTNELHAKIFKV